ncbi:MULTISPECIES: MDR family oxidoreductase [unclassified Streptomyces]|uniref:acrylyl-CoA reductase (NADPH) n=1 Tax=unclassified Streptomyces TaxID=2593676 RepID=UPI001F515238|nr:MDR family oxidoreductase [Streptomyces sp. GZWMJZ-114]
MSFRAIRVTEDEQGRHAAVETLEDERLPPGEVTVDVAYSTVNYKDGLALAGKGIVRTFPLTPGIDLAGTVADSADPRFAPGDRVVLNGFGRGESKDGGFAERARVGADELVPLPDALSTRQAAAIGTAGYTAMLSVLALEDAGVAPGDGDVLVTGAAGGVGSVAISLLAARGYRVIASTGRPEHGDYLRELGAADLVDRATLSAPGKPLASERWAAAVDSVGSHTLANVLAATRYGGTVTACGLAQGLDLPGSVAPFILRGVRLQGIDSVYAPMESRRRAWTALAAELDPAHLDTITETVALADVIPLAPRILAGRVRGRTLVDVRA